jgi:hypothetical protein
VKFRPTRAVGYDAVLPIDPSVYEIIEDARGRAYCFDLEEKRGAVGDAVRRALGDHAEAVERLTIEPGYLRVRYAPRGDPDLSGFLDSLKQVGSVYNDHHARRADLDGLTVDRANIYVGAYTPEDTPSAEAFLNRRVTDDRYPDGDDPVYTYERDSDRDVFGGPRRFRYRFLLPFDPEMYVPSQPNKVETPPVDWRRDAVRDALEKTIQRTPEWPGLPKSYPRIAVYRSHVAVNHYTSSLQDPAVRAARAAGALLWYNRVRPERPELGPEDMTVQHSPLSFANKLYLGVVEGPGTEEWISDHGLDAVDGEPFDPEPEDAEQSDDTGGVLSRFTG